jgi:DNA-binding protein H-NS
MKPNDLKSMSVDELWSLRTLLISVLTGKMSAEKAKIDRQLRQLDLGAASNNSKKIPPHARRPYPQVFPKYSNPAKPSETWAGRGKQPRWLTAQLKAGKKLDDFRIQTLPGRARRSTRQ